MVTISFFGILIACLGGCIVNFTTSILVIAAGLVIAAPGVILAAWRDKHAEY